MACVFGFPGTELLASANCDGAETHAMRLYGRYAWERGDKVAEFIARKNVKEQIA
jgi:hypothetical protein